MDRSSTPLSEHYRPRLRAVLAPAVAVMNRLTYPGKFALISLLFAVPLTLFLYFLLSASNENIGFAQKESQGARYLRPLRQLLEHVMESRLLAHDVAHGDLTRGRKRRPASSATSPACGKS
jgi:hypothetical protein